MHIMCIHTYTHIYRTNCLLFLPNLTRNVCAMIALVDGILNQSRKLLRYTHKHIQQIHTNTYKHIHTRTYIREHMYTALITFGGFERSFIWLCLRICTHQHNTEQLQKSILIGRYMVYIIRTHIWCKHLILFYLFVSYRIISYVLVQYRLSVSILQLATISATETREMQYQ